MEKSFDNSLRLLYAEHGSVISDWLTNCYNKDKHLDIVFICKDNICVHAHKAVLISVSDYLKQIIYNSGDETIFISLPNFDSSVVEIFVNFLYEGVTKVNLQELGNLKELITLLDLQLTNCEIQPFSLVSSEQNSKSVLNSATENIVEKQSNDKNITGSKDVVSSLSSIYESRAENNTFVPSEVENSGSKTFETLSSNIVQEHNVSLIENIAATNEILKASFSSPTADTEQSYSDGTESQYTNLNEDFSNKSLPVIQSNEVATETEGNINFSSVKISTNDILPGLDISTAILDVASLTQTDAEECASQFDTVKESDKPLANDISHFQPVDSNNCRIPKVENENDDSINHNDDAAIGDVDADVSEDQENEIRPILLSTNTGNVFLQSEKCSVQYMQGIHSENSRIHQEDIQLEANNINVFKRKRGRPRKYFSFPFAKEVHLDKGQQALSKKQYQNKEKYTVLKSMCVNRRNYLNKEQKSVLKRVYKKEKYLTKELRDDLVKSLGISRTVLNMWFASQRFRDRTVAATNEVLKASFSSPTADTHDTESSYTNLNEDFSNKSLLDNQGNEVATETEGEENTNFASVTINTNDILPCIDLSSTILGSPSNVPPEPLLGLLTGVDSRSKPFLSLAKNYNAFQMTSFSATKIVCEDVASLTQTDAEECATWFDTADKSDQPLANDISHFQPEDCNNCKIPKVEHENDDSINHNDDVNAAPDDDTGNLRQVAGDQENEIRPILLSTNTELTVLSGTDKNASDPLFNIADILVDPLAAIVDNSQRVNGVSKVENTDDCNASKSGDNDNLCYENDVKLVSNDEENQNVPVLFSTPADTVLVQPEKCNVQYIQSIHSENSRIQQEDIALETSNINLLKRKRGRPRKYFSLPCEKQIQLDEVEQTLKKQESQNKQKNILWRNINRRNYLNKDQKLVLKKVYRKRKYLTKELRDELVKSLGITRTALNMWFATRRFRDRADPRYAERQYTTSNILTVNQINYMKHIYAKSKFPTSETYNRISQDFGVSRKYIWKWFSNRRERERKKGQLYLDSAQRFVNRSQHLRQLNENQRAMLEEAFKDYKYLTNELAAELVTSIGAPESVLRKWFMRKREYAKRKLKRLEAGNVRVNDDLINVLMTHNSESDEEDATSIIAIPNIVNNSNEIVIPDNVQEDSVMEETNIINESILYSTKLYNAPEIDFVPDDRVPVDDDSISVTMPYKPEKPSEENYASGVGKSNTACISNQCKNDDTYEENDDNVILLLDDDHNDDKVILLSDDDQENRLIKQGTLANEEHLYNIDSYQSPSVSNKVKETFIEDKSSKVESLNKRRKIKFTSSQLSVMRYIYNNNRFPTKAIIYKLAEEFKLPWPSVDRWFVHQRVLEKRERSSKVQCVSEKKKVTFTSSEINIMQDIYKNNKFPDTDILNKLAEQFNMSWASVYVWFVHHRESESRDNKNTFAEEIGSNANPCQSNTYSAHNHKENISNVEIEDTDNYRNNGCSFPTISANSENTREDNENTFSEVFDIINANPSRNNTCSTHNYKEDVSQVNIENHSENEDINLKDTDNYRNNGCSFPATASNSETTRTGHRYLDLNKHSVSKPYHLCLLSENQRNMLETTYKETKYVSKNQITELVRRIGVSEYVLRRWFTKKREYERRKIRRLEKPRLVQSLGKKERVRFTSSQVNIMKDIYKNDKSPAKDVIHKLTEDFRLPWLSIYNWFAHQRVVKIQDNETASAEVSKSIDTNHLQNNINSTPNYKENVSSINIEDCRESVNINMRHIDNYINGGSSCLATAANTETKTKGTDDLCEADAEVSNFEFYDESVDLAHNSSLNYQPSDDKTCTIAEIDENSQYIYISDCDDNDDVIPISDDDDDERNENIPI